jgi:hypothetical protein
VFKTISVEYCGESNDIEVGLDGVISISFNSEFNAYEVSYEDSTVTRIHGVTFAEFLK